MESTADFGFRRVPSERKASMVGAVFDSVAPRYDVMNDLMSLGVHRLWKAAMIDRLSPRPGRPVLDLAGGTGDIAFRILERGGGPVLVCDINATMISIGRDRAIDRGRLDGGIAWLVGDAERLPVADQSMATVTCAFGMRNVTHLDAALAEIRRVLRPGGRFLCLEFGRVDVPALARLYDHYSFSVLPVLGRMVAGDAEAYRYLAESIRCFPDQRSFAARVEAAGLARVAVDSLSGGIVGLTSAWRL